VAVALANAQAFGFDTVGCSSTGHLANAVASQAARLGLKTFILVPADLEAGQEFSIPRSMALRWCASRAATTSQPPLVADC